MIGKIITAMHIYICGDGSNDREVSVRADVWVQVMIRVRVRMKYKMYVYALWMIMKMFIRGYYLQN
jgi:hypothetical protein